LTLRWPLLQRAQYRKLPRDAYAHDRGSSPPAAAPSLPAAASVVGRVGSGMKPVLVARRGVRPFGGKWHDHDRYCFFHSWGWATNTPERE
jgi:hypothetical protein